jgi:hypothetical protein
MLLIKCLERIFPSHEKSLKIFFDNCFIIFFRKNSFHRKDQKNSKSCRQIPYNPALNAHLKPLPTSTSRRPNPAPPQPPISQNSQTKPGLSPDWDPPNPCPIENSWKNCMKRVSGSVFTTEAPHYRRRILGHDDKGFLVAGSWHDLQHIVPEITCCIVAKWCYFRASKRYQITIQRLKWSFPESDVWFPIDTLSN